MMSAREYAEDIQRDIQEVLDKCRELEIELKMKMKCSTRRQLSF